MPLSYEVRSLYRFGVFELEAHTGELRRNGIKLKLQDQPYQVLLKLLEHAGQTVTREELRSALWPADTFVDFETGLNTTIKRLRETLGDSAENPTFIETVPKRGYRFIAPVTAPNSGSQSAVGTVARATSVRLSTVLKLGGAVLILVTLSLGFAYRHWRTTPSLVLDFTQLTSDGQAKQGPLLSDGSRIYFSEVLPAGRIVAQVSAKGGETTTIPTTVSDPRPADISPDGTELLILSGGILEKEQPLEPHGGVLWILPVAGGSAQAVDNVMATDAVWGERAETILYLIGHDLYAVNRDGSNRRKLLSVSGYLRSLRRSANSQLLRFTMTTRATGGTSSIWEVSANGGGLREVVPGLPGSVACCGAWMPDHDFLFQWTRAGRTDLWELPGHRGVLSRAPIRLTAGPMNVSQPSASTAPHEVFVVGSIPRGELVKYDPQTAELVPYLSGISAEGVEASRDGNSLVYTLFPEGTLWRTNLTGTERLQLTFPPMRAFLPRWSPDGRQIAFIGATTGERWTTYVIPAEGGVARQLIPGNDQTADATWMPDNQSIVFGPWKDAESLGVRVLDVKTNQVRPLPGATGMYSPRTSPDGRYIAALSAQDSKMMLFDTRTEKWEELSAFYSGYPSWSRNGKFLYFQVWNRGIEHPARVVRMRISDRRMETVLDLNRLDRLSIGTFMSWSGLAPDDSVLLSRNNSTQEIYAVKW